jgi:hypothetical protein
MTTRQLPEVLLARDEIVSGPIERACTDQTFELPTKIYAAMAIMFAGAITVLCLAFREHMAVTAGVLFAFLAAFFAIPATFSVAAPEHGSKALSWFDFTNRGIATATGRTGALEATILVLILPFLILCWSIAVVIIATLV